MAKKANMAEAAKSMTGGIGKSDAQPTKKKEPSKDKRGSKRKDMPVEAGEWDGKYRKWTFSIRTDQHERLGDISYRLKKESGDLFRMASLVRLALERFFEDIEDDQDAIVDALYKLELWEHERNQDRVYAMTRTGLDKVKEERE